MGMRILMVCDSPTVATGFGRVALELVNRWARDGRVEKVDVWGINYRGWPHTLPCRIFPATLGDEAWHAPGRLEGLLAKIMDEKPAYTHIWMMQDTFLLSQYGFPAALRQACEKRGMVSMGYFPVDAPLDSKWVEVVAAVDVPVSYTLYGKQEMLKHLGNGYVEQIHVVPHGVNREVFVQWGSEQRDEARRKLFVNGEFLKPGDILMLNVNVHQRRKDVVRSLQILARLIEQDRMSGNTPSRWKLLMHMAEHANGVGLEQVASQLGLRRGVDWEHTGETFKGNRATLAEADLVKFYNCADVFLTTTLGEGWGLGITEAMACGCTVAVPWHTACQEIGVLAQEHGVNAYRVVAMGLEDEGCVAELDNSRLRFRVNVVDAVQKLEDWRRVHDRAGGERLDEESMPERLRRLWSWERIANVFLNMLYNAEMKKQRYYLEYGGGLGDVFNQLYLRGSYQLLENLKPGETAEIVLACNNPFARELFQWHPKRDQFEVKDLGYWDPRDDEKVRVKHQLPAAGGLFRLPETEIPAGGLRFYPSPQDQEVLGEVSSLKFEVSSDPASPVGLRRDSSRCSSPGYVVFAPGAGLPGRNIPDELYGRMVHWVLSHTEYGIVVVGRTYDRHGRKEPDFPIDLEKVDLPWKNRVLNLVDKLSVPGVAVLLQGSSGLVTCHSALNILCWKIGEIPQVLVYPQDVKERHFQRKDQWSQGMDDPLTRHGLFEEWSESWMEVLR